MSSLNCPNCNGPIKLGNSVCPYCASPLPGGWTPQTTLPEPSAANPSRSDYVLVCWDMESTSAENYPGTIVSAYYDYTARNWTNDLYPNSSKLISVSHWMPIPAADLPMWVAASSYPERRDHQPDQTIEVLICRQGPDYARSLICAAFYSKIQVWVSTLGSVLEYDPEKADIDPMAMPGDVKPTHWMPVPESPCKHRVVSPPVAPAATPPASKSGLGGFFKKFI